MANTAKKGDLAMHAVPTVIELSSTCCIFGGGVDTDFIASIAPKGTQQGRAKSKGKPLVGY